MTRIVKIDKDVENLSLENVPITRDIIKTVSVNNCMTSAEELTDIVKCLLYSKPKEGESVIELGTYQGRTAKVIGTVLEELKLYNTLISVDCFVHGYPIISQWIENNKDKNTMLVVSDTRKFLSNWKISSPFIFVDAGHEYKDAYYDIVNSMSLVRKGGVLFIDDYNGWSYPGVYQAVNELLKENKQYKQLIFSSVYTAYEKLI